MLSFFKKNDPAVHALPFQKLKVDMHAHWLPGIDDGAATLEESMELLRKLQNLGYTKLIATPHIYQELYPNSPETILPALEQVRQEAQNQNIPLQLEAAAEYFLDEHFEDLLDKDQILSFSNKRVLIEMSFLAPYPNLHQTVYKLRRKGYKPVLAHPERYLYLAKNIEEFEKIQSYGCELQVNLLSLAGYYGKAEKKLALNMLEADLVDFLGTDLHNAKHHEALAKLGQDRQFHLLLERYAFRNHLL
ncbi:MAG: histidinol phosphatase [Bacteroidetes bacterium]|nr:histidinol phosphatase [Bacteroidota bacterium]